MANENLMDVRSAYDTVAETYSAVIPDTSFEAPLDMAMMDHFIAHMRGTADRTVIDVGCGAGRMTSYLGHAGLNVSGVDLSPEMVRIAQQLHHPLSPDGAAGDCSRVLEGAPPWRFGARRLPRRQRPPHD